MANSMTTATSEEISDGRRSFIAVSLPPDVRGALTAAMGELRARLGGVAWARKPENLHVTIKFLGKVTDAHLAALDAAVRRALAALPAFAISVQGVGAFPTAKHARVIWAGIDDASGGLARIAAAVESVAAALNLPQAEREKGTHPFRGHITVGRAKPPLDLRVPLAALDKQPFVFGTFPVSEVHLYESRLSPLGSTYILQSRFALEARAPG